MSLHETVSALHARAPSLSLGALDVCFLAALSLRAEGEGAPSFAEELLFDVHEEVTRLCEGPSEAPRVRATAAIRRLRTQRLLVRVDGAGLRRSGEYALSRLGRAIVDFFLEDEVLTQQNLAVLLSALRERLLAIQQAAQVADSEAAWTERVSLPLEITTADLLDGIERRQRGFDLQQEQFQARITELLRADWFGAIEECESLLSRTSDTLRELYALLLGDGHTLQQQLSEIVELAAASALSAAQTSEQHARRLLVEVDRITAWGTERHVAWAEYHEQVHRYLRDVVRLDPSRAMVDRLRKNLAEGGRSFALVVAHNAPMSLLRAEVGEVSAPPVRRPKKSAEVEPESAEVSDPEAELLARVRAALAEGKERLSQITRELAEGDDRFVVAGRVAEVVGKVAAELDASAERPWADAGEGLMIEEWSARQVKDDD